MPFLQCLRLLLPHVCVLQHMFGYNAIYKQKHWMHFAFLHLMLTFNDFPSEFKVTDKVKIKKGVDGVATFACMVVIKLWKESLFLILPLWSNQTCLIWLLYIVFSLVRIVLFNDVNDNNNKYESSYLHQAGSCTLAKTTMVGNRHRKEGQIMCLAIRMFAIILQVSIMFLC